MDSKANTQIKSMYQTKVTIFFFAEIVCLDWKDTLPKGDCA